MWEREIKTAQQFGILKQCKAFEKDLLQIKDIVPDKFDDGVPFDLSGFLGDIHHVIIVPKYYIRADMDDYWEARKQLKECVITTAEKYDLHRTEDSIENYGEYFYFVFRCGKTWTKCGSEKAVAEILKEDRPMAQYMYLRGSSDSRETVEYDILRYGQYITTCIVDVKLLICGIKSFLCGNGDDVKLTARQQLDILEIVQDERRRITRGISAKTMDSWYRSGLNFDEYCFPGDIVSQNLVDEFVNSVPPVLLRSDCTQAGEEYSSAPDGDGAYHPTFTTFHSIGNGFWKFDGYCFKGENQNRVEKTYKRRRFEERFAEVWRAVESE